MSKSYRRKNEEELKTVTVGDVLIQTDDQGQPKEMVVVDDDGNKGPKLYAMKANIPEGVDEAGIGEPSMVIKHGDYFNFKVPELDEIEKLRENPKTEWKADKLQLTCWKTKQAHKKN